jgi:hypothetical protein
MRNFSSVSTGMPFSAALSDRIASLRTTHETCSRCRELPIIVPHSAPLFETCDRLGEGIRSKRAAGLRKEKTPAGRLSQPKGRDQTQ